MTSSVEQPPVRVGVILGTTRPGRKADSVAEWVLGIASTQQAASFEIVDIADYDLPFLDELMPAMAGEYSLPHTHRWAEKIGSYDAFIFVTPEYNASVSSSLKNAIDFLYAEWNEKPAGFVAYGMQGGVRVIESLRMIFGDLRMTCVPSTVNLHLREDFQEMIAFTPGESREKQLLSMLDELLTEARGRAAEA